ncbi:4Fe-4S binding protein [Sedimentibacter sp. MB31-C6]|uniref:4Fe-4S binding protein n=1 Tax=Sedimentibacter sp. MB31-C6 TaxID=3109366 RepID=UPI002DDCCD1F|nr:4Fe-4S binding protein [Sedimentibacter sp. MB36-C1]WSI04456.1 4Fe-4S binding protein [Sedimentibacter sp. MB36-C1]
MAGIMDVVGIINNLDYRPKYERVKCIKNISPKASCNICEEVCSKKAVKINKKGITISESCNFCNECVSHCPTNALVDTGRKFMGADKKIYLLCNKHKLNENINNNSRIECLNFLSTKILLNIYNNGFREIHTNLNKCDNCQRSHNLQIELDRTNIILNNLNLPPMSVHNEDVENLVEYVKEAEKIKKDTPIDRRSFFKHMAKDLFGKTYEIAPPAIRVQFWRSTGQILQKWQQNNENKLSVYLVDIDKDRCIQCKACMKMCTHNVWEENNDTIVFRTYLCTGCNLCKDICPTKAIDIRENFEIINETIFFNTKKECISCKKEFFASITETDVCPTCTWKNTKK